MFNKFRRSENSCVVIHYIADWTLLFLHHFNELCETELFWAAHLAERWRVKPNNLISTLEYFFLLS